jgi:azurin
MLQFQGPFLPRFCFRLSQLLCATPLLAGNGFAQGDSDVNVQIGTVRALMKYDVTEFSVPASAMVKVVFENTDDLPHNLAFLNAEGISMEIAQLAWVLGEKGFEKHWLPDDQRILAATKMIDPGAKEELVFKAPGKKGRYDYVCTYPGHAALMKGVMIVGDPSTTAKSNKSGPIRDLNYTVYTGKWDRLPDFSKLTPKSTDSIEGGRIDLNVSGKLNEGFGLVFDGLLDVPEDGEFEFVLASDDGSQLFIDDQLVVDNDRIHAHAEKKAKVKLSKGEKRLRVTYFEKSGQESLSVGWNGPGLKGKQRRLSTTPPKRRGQAPRGILLVPDQQPIIYRNFIEGAGNRAIAVGFPERVSIAFDADQLRLALMWTGDFIDAARHWNGRGSGHQPPAGDNVVAAPEGEAFAVLESADSPWPQPFPQAANGRFIGYRFWGKAKNPEFRYEVGKHLVHDRPVGVSRNGTFFLERALTVTADEPSDRLFMRVASGDIARESEGSFLTATQRINLPREAKLIKGNLLVPLQFTSGKATFGITYEWMAQANTTPKGEANE